MRDNKHKDGKSMKESMGDYLRAMGVDKKVIEMSVLEKWGALMGDAVDKRTKTKVIKDETLILTINSSVMRDELMQRRTEIIQKVNNAAGFELIKDVFFK